MSDILGQVVEVEAGVVRGGIPYVTIGSSTGNFAATDGFGFFWIFNAFSGLVVTAYIAGDFHPTYVVRNEDLSAGSLQWRIDLPSNPPRARLPAAHPNIEYYNRRIAEHCDWFLRNQGYPQWAARIKEAAATDALGQVTSYYWRRYADHAEWWLVRVVSRIDLWNQIEASARADAAA